MCVCWGGGMKWERRPAVARAGSVQSTECGSARCEEDIQWGGGGGNVSSSCSAVMTDDRVVSRVLAYQ